MNIVVLAGGTSTERDISIMTSVKVCESLRRNGHNAWNRRQGGRDIF